MRIPDPRRSLPLLVLLAAASTLLVESWDRFQGRLNYLQLEDMKSRWHDTTGVPHDRELNEAFKLGYRALERESASSEYHFMLASMHAWREKGLRLWPGQAAAESRKIIENLKAALSRRPSWFEAWAMLALVKYQSGEVDHELRVALEKSIETGPYEAAVHHGLAFVGLRIWDKLEPDLRQGIVDTLHIALDNPDIRKLVVEQIVMTGREEAFRDKLESSEELAGLTSRFIKKRNEAL